MSRWTCMHLKSAGGSQQSTWSQQDLAGWWAFLSFMSLLFFRRPTEALYFILQASIVRQSWLPFTLGISPEPCLCWAGSNGEVCLYDQHGSSSHWLTTELSALGYRGCQGWDFWLTQPMTKVFQPFSLVSFLRHICSFHWFLQLRYACAFEISHVDEWRLARPCIREVQYYVSILEWALHNTLPLDENSLPAASLPTAKMVFSNAICVRTRNSVQHLMIRVGNARGNILYSPDIRLA